MRLLIPIPRKHESALRTELNRVAAFDWAWGRKIHVVSIDDEQSEEANYQLIRNCCQENRIERILILGKLRCRLDWLRNAGLVVQMERSAKHVVYDRAALQRLLGDLRLDWFGEAAARLNYYALAQVGSEEIEKWLHQFERLGGYRQVGEHLLQLLDVVPHAELSESLAADAEFYGSDLVVGFNDEKLGKSGNTISNLVGKRCQKARLLPIADAIEQAAHPRVLRLVEDGLFTGTETIGILDSLRGARPAGRAPKARPLDDPAILSTLAVHLHFAAVCDFGELALREYLQRNALPNVHVNVGAARRKLRVLDVAPAPDSPPGAVPEPVGSSAYKLRLLDRVTPYVFQPDQGCWKSGEHLRRARSFCESVGEQLWLAYLQKKEFMSPAWPPARIKRCALGMDGLGLAIAFPHSVPKASLPLFWARGTVTLNDRKIDWVPLFPHADT